MSIRSFFTLIVIATATVLAIVAVRARPKRAWTVIIGLTVWLGLTAFLAEAGALNNFDRFPPPVLLLFAGSFALTTGIAWSSVGRSLAGVPVAWLIGFQTFRLPVELFLSWGYHAGLVPPQMTMEGRNWDILTGLTALPVAWLVTRGTAGRRIVLLWNIAGIALLSNIVAVAILSMPTPLLSFGNGQVNTFVTRAPYVWLPTFLVQAGWLGHLLLFRRLISGEEKFTGSCISHSDLRSSDTRPSVPCPRIPR